MPDLAVRCTFTVHWLSLARSLTPSRARHGMYPPPICCCLSETSIHLPQACRRCCRASCSRAHASRGPCLAGGVRASAHMPRRERCMYGLAAGKGGMPSGRAASAGPNRHSRTAPLHRALPLQHALQAAHTSGAPERAASLSNCAPLTAVWPPHARETAARALIAGMPSRGAAPTRGWRPFAILGYGYPTLRRGSLGHCAGGASLVARVAGCGGSPGLRPGAVRLY